MNQSTLSSFVVRQDRPSPLVEDLLAEVVMLQRKRERDSEMSKVKKPRKDTPWRKWSKEKKAEVGQKLLDSSYARLKVSFLLGQSFYSLVFEGGLTFKKSMLLIILCLKKN